MAVRDKVQIEYGATDRTGPATRSALGNLRAMNKEAVAAQAIAQSWDKGLTRNSRMVQQLGMQVTDFSVQLAGGQNALLAFIQNGSQLLQFFGPFGAVLAAIVTVFGTMALVAGKSGFAFVELASAFSLMSADMALIVSGLQYVKQVFIDLTNLILNNATAILAAVSLVAGYFASTWVVAMVRAALATNVVRAAVLSTVMTYRLAGPAVAAATLATNLFTGAMVALRGVLVSLGIPALVIGLALLIQAFMRLRVGAGSFGEALGLVGDVISAVFKAFPLTVEWAFKTVNAKLIDLKADFLEAFSGIAEAWNKLMNGIAAGWNSLSKLASKIGVDMGTMDVMQSAAERIKELRDEAAKLRKEAGEAADSIGVKKAMDALRAAMDKGTTKIDITGIGGGGGGKGGGAVEEAETEAEKIEKIFAQMQSSISDSIMGSFKALLKGTKSLGESVADILNNILDKVIDLLMTPIFNSVAEGIVGGIRGGLTGMGAEIESYAGGGYTGDGVRAGGLDGKGGRLAVLHPSESVVDHTARGQGNSRPPVVINMHITTPDAQSFQASRRQIAAQLREVMG